jgi:hypothetical protein
MLSQGSSGVPQAPNTSSLGVPSGQGGGAPDISITSEAVRLQMESPAHTRNEGINQMTNKTLLEERKVLRQEGYVSLYLAKTFLLFHCMLVLERTGFVP